MSGDFEERGNRKEERENGTLGVGRVWGLFPRSSFLFPVLLLAWRESRFVRRRLFLFLSAISLGVAALVAVQGFSANLAAGVREQARALLGADLQLSSRQPFGEGTEALLDSLARAGVPVSRAVGFVSMAQVPRTEGTRLVQVRAVEGGFPYYGTIDTRPAGRWESLGAGRNVLVDPALLIALDAAVGDTLALGLGRFQISGALDRVPGDIEMASAFAPRIYIPFGYVEETGLLEVGSRVDYEAFLQLPAGAVERLVAANRPLLREERVSARTAEGQQQMLADALGRLGSYLGLVAVFALLLGGIGVASAMRAFMAQKSDSIAVLRCLGATSGQVFGVYLVQAAAMGLAGAALGVVLGLAAQFVLPALLAGMLPVEVQVAADARAVLTGLGVGLWVALVFALLPLLGTRRISPLGALRRQAEPTLLAGRDRWRWGAWGALAASVLLLASLQVGSLRVGAAFALGIGLALAVLAAASGAAVHGMRRLRPGGGLYTLRQGLANLHRPGNQTVAVVLALGFGVFLLATLYVAQDNLLRPLQRSEVRANLLLWDVQEDQHAPATALLRGGGHEVLQSAPIVPMRIAAINGRRVRGARGAEQPEWRPGEPAPSGWAVRREYRSTFRDSTVASERVVEGRWWTAATADTAALVSLERGLAEELGVGVGDRVTWDVQGVEVTTTVSSLREVDWARFEPNFFAVFHPAALAGAPQTRVLLARVADATERARVQRTLVERFPNVAILDLTQLQSALDSVLGRVTAVIRFLAAFSIATGFVVLLGAVASGRLQRIRESVLLKTLGATRRQIGAILLTEYLALGLLASAVGAGAAVLAGWALARWWFGLGYAVPALELLALAAAVTLLAGAVGVWGGREVFRRTPLEALREE
jgi:putative ABC transport system permease protein